MKKAEREKNPVCENAYRYWIGLISNYKYGKRKLTLSPEWFEFDDFWKWCNGKWTLNSALSRIDRRKGYSPENCVITERYTEKKSHLPKLHEIDGMSKTLSEWCEYYAIKYSTVINRMTVYGYSLEDALKFPIKNKALTCTIDGKTKTLKEWCKEYGINEYTVLTRIRNRKWSMESAITTPLKCVSWRTIDNRIKRQS